MLSSINRIKIGFLFRRPSLVTMQAMNFRAALILSGNGVYDGTETTEAVSTIVALSKQKVEVQCFAPDKEQHHVVNHLDGSEMDQTRNALVESARIARGDVKKLDELKAADFDAVFVPGGFGAAKNLSDFAVKGEGMSVDPQVERVLLEF
mmetsp:Transcript_7017/g.11786  ORF Transcript_7017/g.11786 Transcript_7017/m.11786 type:complete len:150 (+) Transcript_7017:35-484(+)